jgi:intracellular sulfur oxidation DsrE/DsrF family protein
MSISKIILALGDSLWLAGSLPAAGPAAAPAERPMLKVNPRGHYKVVYDIHSSGTAAGISRGLYFAARPDRGVRQAGCETRATRHASGLHVDAAQFLLVDEAYQAAVADPFAANLNAKITQDLLNLGVSVGACHSVMKPKDVMSGVSIVHDGYTRPVKLQNDGHAYIGGF